MSRTTMIIIITVAIAILYLTYDAVRRSREKKLPYVFKRKYHQFEGWLNVTALGLTIDALIIPWDIAWTGTWNTILFGGTALLSANFLYAYEMEYFSIHSDGTIKYHTRTGKIITTHFNCINKYTYSPWGKNFRGGEDISFPDIFHLRTKDNKTAAKFSIKATKEYSIAAHVIFRQEKGRWARIHSSEDQAQIEEILHDKKAIIQYLTKNPQGTDLADDSAHYM